MPLVETDDRGSPVESRRERTRRLREGQAAPDAGGLAGDDRRLLERQEGDAGDQRDPALESHARATLDRDERARKAPIAIAITHRWTKPKVARW